jgi:transposase
MRYGLKRWRGLVRFLDDGGIDVDTNSVERANRLIAMTDSFCTSSSVI